MGKSGPISTRRGKPCDPPADVPEVITNDEVAANTWRELTAHLARTGLWRDEVAHLVVLAATLESRRRRAEELIAKEGIYCHDQRGRVALSPAVRVAEACSREIRAIYRDLGIVGGAKQGDRDDQLGIWADFVD
jgi:phage terminase small subunit